jgi:hypothetical protein
MPEEEFNLFSKSDLFDIFNTEKKILSKEIYRNLKEDLKKKAKKDLIERYFNEHKFRPVKIDFKNLKKEKYISSHSKYLRKKKRIFRAREMSFITYIFPIEGDLNLLNYKPLGKLRKWTVRVFIKDKTIGFEKMTYVNNTDDYKEEVDVVIRVIKNQLELINNQIENYNRSLRNYIKELIESKKDNLNNQ